MLLKIISNSTVDEPGEFREFKASWAAPEYGPIYVLIDDLEARLINLERNLSVFAVLIVILVTDDANVEQAEALLEITVGGYGRFQRFNQRLSLPFQVFYLLLANILEKNLTCILPALHIAIALL